MAEIIKTIGASGADYTTLAAWEAAMPATLATDTDYVAELFPGSHTANITFSGFSAGTNAGIVIRPHATAMPGNVGHGGIAAGVSGATTNAVVTGRFTTLLSPPPARFKLYDLEFIHDAFTALVTFSATSAMTYTMARCILHPSTLINNAGNRGVHINNANILTILYRNIFYGFGGDGVYIESAANGTTIVNNTSYSNSRAAATNRYNIVVTSASVVCVVKNNLCLVPGPGGGAAQDINIDVVHTRAKNATSDTTGDLGYRSLVPADTCVSTPTTFVTGTTNCLLKSGSAAIDAGDNLGTPYDVDVQNQSVSGTWDIGADEGATTVTGPCATTSSFFYVELVGPSTYNPRVASNPRITDTTGAGAYISKMHAYFDISGIPQGIRITSMTVNFTVVSTVDGYFGIKNLPYPIGSSDGTLWENTNGVNIVGSPTIQVATGAFAITCNQTGMDKLTQAVNNSTGYFAIQMLAEQNPGGPTYRYDINDQVCLDIQYEEVPVVEGTAMLGSPKKRTRLNAMRAVTT